MAESTGALAALPPGTLARFPDVRGHLDAATCGVPPLAASAAMRRAVDEWAQGRVDGPGFDADVERARAAFARLVRADPRHVAQGAQVSVFVGMIAASLPAGARVLTVPGDFTSLLFPLLAQEPRGVQVREVPLESLAEAIDARTDLVAVSAAQSADGRVADLGALAAAADHHGAAVLLDATQACGWMPIDAGRFDYVVAGAYKWLCSPRGTAFMAVTPEALERLVPQAAGWYAAAAPWDTCYGGPLRLPSVARRLDVSPAWACWAGTAPAVELIADIGPDALGAYDLALAGRLAAGLGLPAPSSPILTTSVPHAAQRLRHAGIRASVRAGRVRLSCHVPATAADVDRCLEALAA